MTPGTVGEDGLLDHAIRLRQPQEGYRAGSDAVLLAAAVPAQAGQQVLDAGAGVGAIGLCLAWRVPGVAVTGLERVTALAELGNANARLNGLDARLQVICGEVERPPAAIRQARFDHVVCNPPFYEEGRASPSPAGLKSLAHLEGEVPLADWIAFCIRRTRPGGTVTLIHRAGRLAELLAGLGDGAGDVLVCPLWPTAGRPARRVIVQARAQRRGPPTLLAGVVLHEADGGDTAAARALLRDGAALDLRAMASPQP